LNRGETFKNIKDIQNKIISLIKTNKWSFKRLNLTAPWQPTIDGKLLNKILEIYKNNFHKTPKVEVIPGVLESGEILSKYPKMSAISIGPNLHDVHTPNERMELKSFYFVYNVLCSILSKIN
jgi:dipeptidase D